MDTLRQRLLIQQIIPGQPQVGPEVEWQIVGVIHNVRYGDFRDDSPEIDVPFAQSLAPNVTMGVRTSGDPAAMTSTIAAAVHSVDPQIALGRIRTMDQVKNESLAEDRFTMVLFAGFAAVALLLAAVGIYGLMAFAVSQRTQEIGLRLALGSGRQRVIWLILKRRRCYRRKLDLGISGLAGFLCWSAGLCRLLCMRVSALDFSVIVSVAAILFVT